MNLAQLSTFSSGLFLQSSVVSLLHLPLNFILSTVLSDSLRALVIAGLSSTHTMPAAEFNFYHFPYPPLPMCDHLASGTISLMLFLKHSERTLEMVFPPPVTFVSWISTWISSDTHGAPSLPSEKRPSQRSEPLYKSKFPLSSSHSLLTLLCLFTALTNTYHIIYSSVYLPIVYSYKNVSSMMVLGFASFICCCIH